jgi:hypothetical protein
LTDGIVGLVKYIFGWNALSSFGSYISLLFFILFFLTLIYGKHPKLEILGKKI